MSELNPSEAQRKAMADMLLEYRDCFSISSAEIVEDMITAANGIPEGAPVGTIARRPDGVFVAVRILTDYLERYWTYTCTDHSLNDDWPDPDDADSWPVIYDPTRRHARKVREAIESWRDSHPGDKSTVAFLVEVVEDLLAESDPTAQQEPDRFPGIENPSTSDYIGAAVADEQLKMVFALRDIRKQRGMEVADVAEAADVLASEVSMFESGSSNPTLSLVRRYAKAVEAVFTVDVRKWEDTPVQQEPCCGVSEVYDCDCPPAIRVSPKPRSPRVVDRLGVDEQGSRWRDRDGDEWRYLAGRGWQYTDEGSFVDYVVDNPSGDGPYVEILDPSDS